MKHYATLDICEAANGRLYARVNQKHGDPIYYHVGTSTNDDALFLRPVTRRIADQLELAFKQEVRKASQASLFPVMLEEKARAAAT